MSIIETKSNKYSNSVTLVGVVDLLTKSNMHNRERAKCYKELSTFFQFAVYLVARILFFTK